MLSRSRRQDHADVCQIRYGRLWYACEHPQMTCRAPLWTGSSLPVADPRGPVSDSLRSLIDGARTVGASRRATRGLLELAYDVCSQSASITDVQVVRTCPLSDGFPVRHRRASTGSPTRAGATWCATTPRGSA